jgi:NitT/TauT family transport system permease protein
VLPLPSTIAVRFAETFQVQMIGLAFTALTTLAGLALARLAGGTPWRIFLKVRLMHAVPYITDALKVGFPLALVGSIVGEFIGGNDGIGRLILAGQFELDTPLVFAALVSISVFTMLGIGSIALFEQRVLKWRPSQRER